MQTYLSLLRHLLENGKEKEDRTGTGTLSIFGKMMRFDLQNGFPLLTTKKVHIKSVIYELLWFLRGDTNVQFLQENKVSIWDEWADEKGELGPIYGKQWRSWNTGTKSIDQITQVINQIRTNPASRRHIVSAWNVGELNAMALPPCHILFQFNVVGNKLNCALYQRSADAFLGLPFNIASYALLTMLVAKVCDLEAGEFVHFLGDVHLYKNHTEQAKLQISRTPKALPTIVFSKKDTIFDYKYEDFALQSYNPYPTIKAPIAI